jgi:hypothetical protein
MPSAADANLVAVPILIFLKTGSVRTAEARFLTYKELNVA